MYIYANVSSIVANTLAGYLYQHAKKQEQGAQDPRLLTARRRVLEERYSERCP